MSASPLTIRLASLTLAALIAACGGDAGTGGSVPITRVARPPANEMTRSAGTDPARAPSSAAEPTIPLRTGTVLRMAVGTPVPTADTPRTGTPEITGAGDFGIVAFQGARRLGGREVRFRSIFAAGKPVVLNLWAGRCPPCRLEMPGFQSVWEEHRPDVLFVGVDVGAFTGLGSHADARALMDELGITYPSGYAVDPSPLATYRVGTMPTTLFFTGQGALVHRRDGYLPEADLRGIVQQMAASAQAAEDE